MLCLYLSLTIQKESERVWRKKVPKGKPRCRLCWKNTEARLQGFLGSEDPVKSRSCKGGQSTKSSLVSEM